MFHFKIIWSNKQLLSDLNKRCNKKNTIKKHKACYYKKQWNNGEASRLREGVSESNASNLWLYCWLCCYFWCCFWNIVYVMTTVSTTKFLNPNKNKISKIFAQDTTVVKNEYSKYWFLIKSIFTWGKHIHKSIKNKKDTYTVQTQKIIRFYHTVLWNT